MYCGPERLDALQRLFDMLCMIIQQRARGSGVPQVEIPPDKIASAIMQCAEANMSDGDTFLTVLELFGFSSSEVALAVDRDGSHSTSPSHNRNSPAA
jgi:hypothetical protein